MTRFSKKIQKLTGCAENAATFTMVNLPRTNVPTASMREHIFKFFVKITRCKKIAKIEYLSYNTVQGIWV